MTPPVEPPYVVSLKEIFWGGVLVAVTMTLHGLGMLTILRLNTRMKAKFQATESFFAGLAQLVFTSWMILLVHLIEVFFWAGFFYWQSAVNQPGATSSLCYYFSLNEYTTLGSNYNLVQNWRLLEGMISMAGLMTFAWSTGVLLTLAQDFQDEHLSRFKRQLEKSEKPKQKK